MRTRRLSGRSSADRAELLGLLLAPRPRLLTGFEPPAYVTDVGVSPTGDLAMVAVARPFGGGGPIGGDLVRVDLASSQVATLVSRGDATPLSYVSGYGTTAWLPG